MDRRTQQDLIARLRGDAQRIAGRFGLRYRSIEPERANVKRRYGVCFSDGEIRIRLRHAHSGEPLKYSSLVNTLCHELAHLKHFHHGERFKAFYLDLLAWARSEGIYRPDPRSGAPSGRRADARRPRAAAASTDNGPKATPREPPRPPGPRQLGLFG